MTATPKKSVLIQLNKLQAYRIPIFERLGQIYDLDVVVSSPPPEQPTSFRVITSRRTALGKFSLQKWSGRPVDSYAAVVSILDMRNLTALWLILTRRSTIPYCLGYGHSFLSSMLRRWVFKQSKAILVYTQGMAQEVMRSGVDAKQVFYTGNTVAVTDAPPPEGPRTEFLHVGTPKPRKQVEALLQAFARVVGSLPAETSISIVGPGAETAFGGLARTLGISERVRFLGDIRDPQRLEELFGKAIAYVSPGHVGLGALQAIGYGVPVVTRSDREQGPEFETCIDGLTARLYRGEDALDGILVDLATNPEAARVLGRAGRDLYSAAYHPDQMARRISAAVEAVSN